ncbi:hypothetical protein SFUMM280S_02278 [Streptomyces fumanus]
MRAVCSATAGCAGGPGPAVGVLVAGRLGRRLRVRVVAVAVVAGGGQLLSRVRGGVGGVRLLLGVRVVAVALVLLLLLCVRVVRLLRCGGRRRGRAVDGPAVLVVADEFVRAVVTAAVSRVVLVVHRWGPLSAQSPRYNWRLSM